MCKTKLEVFMLPRLTPEKWGSFTEPAQMVPKLHLRQRCNADPLRASSGVEIQSPSVGTNWMMYLNSFLSFSVSLFQAPLPVRYQQVSCTRSLFSGAETADYRSSPNSSKWTGHLARSLKEKDYKMEGKESGKETLWMAGWEWENVKIFKCMNSNESTSRVEETINN